MVHCCATLLFCHQEKVGIQKGMRLCYGLKKFLTHALEMILADPHIGKCSHESLFGLREGLFCVLLQSRGMNYSSQAQRVFWLQAVVKAV